MYRTDAVRIHSILSSNKSLLFHKKHEKCLTIKIIKKMKTIPMKQSNEKSITIHTFEETEACYPFAILEENKVNEQGKTTTTFQPVLGNTKVTQETFETFNQTIDYIQSKPYNLIFALICHCMKMKDNFEKEQQLLKEQNHETK